VRVPIDDAATAARLGGVHYFQIDLVADALQGNPLVFCTLEMPSGMPLGGDCPDFRRQPTRHPSLVGDGENGTVPLGTPYSQPVEVTGYFLKMWQYPTGMTTGERAEHPGASVALQTAPLLIGPPPEWKPAPVAKGSSSEWLTGGIVALAMTGLGLLLWSIRQSDQEFSRYLKV
jgi:hypothetical protein